MPAADHLARVVPSRQATAKPNGRPQLSGEREFIEQLQARLPAAPAGQTWIGDDAAVLDDGLLLATDVLVEDVHFNLDWATPADVGWKALAVNVSDIAAMGGMPRAAVVAVALPPGRAGLAEQVLVGLAEAAASFHCPLVGGDTSTGSQLVVSVAVVGAGPAGGSVLRSGAQEGDFVFVTGPLGAAGAALRALRAGDPPHPQGFQQLIRPTARVDHGRAVVAAAGTAMIDVSDGLASELRHLSRASSVGVHVRAEAIPLGAEATLEDAFGAGDDYELVFTAPNRGATVEAFAGAELPEPRWIGEVTGGNELALERADGSVVAVPAAGWEHPVP